MAPEEAQEVARVAVVARAVLRGPRWAILACPRRDSTREDNNGPCCFSTRTCPGREPGRPRGGLQGGSTGTYKDLHITRQQRKGNMYKFEGTNSDAPARFHQQLRKKEK